jgi:hypothetical protein
LRNPFRQSLVDKNKKHATKVWRVVKNYWKLCMGRRTFKRPRQRCPLVLWNHGPDRHLTTSQASPIPTSTSPHLGSLEPFALQVSPLSKSVGPPRYNISSHVLARPLLHRSSPGHYNEKTSVLSGFAHSSFFLSLLVKRRNQHQGEVIVIRT